MQLNQLDLYQFRNLKNQHVEFPTAFTVIIGDNGHGKTSLLEAVSILAHGKSFRSSKLTELVSWDAKSDTPVETAVSATVVSKEGVGEISFRLQNSRKNISINGKKISQAEDFYGRLCCVEFTPDDLQLVSGPPLIRRQFIDRIIAMVDKSYVKQLVGYQRSIKNRNKHLESLKFTPIEQAKSSLSAWDAVLSEYGRAISAGRKKFIDEITNDTAQFYERFTEYKAQQKREHCSVAYVGHFFADGRLLDQNELCEIYRNKAEQDIRAKKTLFGPHRDDVTVLLDSGGGLKSARTISSQGQKRSLSLALKFSAAKYLLRKTSEAPIILLDDVESELDATRRELLFETARELGSQVIVTATELSDQCEKGLRNPTVLHLKNGLVL